MLLFLVACSGPSVDWADSADTGTPVDLVTSLVEPGPYRVGYRQSSVTYSDDISSDRTLRLSLWFPTDQTSGANAAYLDGAIDAPDVLDDPSPIAGTLPVVLFSHGHRGFAENSSFLMEHLASHGYVVAAPDHTGNTTLDSPDRDSEIYLRRPRDLTAVLDVLPDELDVDTSAVTALGHSFGGYTLYAIAGATYDTSVIDACTPESSSFCSTMTPALAAALRGGARDPRVTAIVPMAPGDYVLFGASGVATVAVPTLLMTGTLDESTATNGDLYWAAHPGADDRRLSVTGAGHQAFTDFSGVLADGGTIEPQLGFDIMDAYALAAVRAAGGDDTVRPLLDGELTVADEGILYQ